MKLGLALPALALLCTFFLACSRSSLLPGPSPEEAERIIEQLGPTEDAVYIPIDRLPLGAQNGFWIVSNAGMPTLTDKGRSFFSYLAPYPSGTCCYYALLSHPLPRHILAVTAIGDAALGGKDVAYTYTLDFPAEVKPYVDIEVRKALVTLQHSIGGLHVSAK